MPRVIIVDDEPLARQGLRQLLTTQGGIELVGEAGSAAEARALIARVRPDAIFLDVELTDGNGFDLLPEIEPRPAIIFVTAYTAYASEAFAVDAVDYLVKPVRPERLAAALKRLERAGPRDTLAAQTKEGGLLSVRARGRLVTVLVDSIVVVAAERDYARIHAVDMPPLLTNHALRFFEEHLPQPPFLRVGRSLLIHGGRLREVHRLSRDETRVHLDGLAEPLALGRAAGAALRSALRRT